MLAGACRDVNRQRPARHFSAQARLVVIDVRLDLCGEPLTTTDHRIFMAPYSVYVISLLVSMCTWLLFSCGS